MIIKFSPENIFGLYPEVIVHLVSCTGLSHDGFSKQLKKIFPAYFQEYTRSCLRKQMVPGQIKIYPLQVLFGTRYIVTMPVKNNWQEKTQKDFVHQGLVQFSKECEKLQLSTCAMPKIDDLDRGWLENEIKKVFSHISTPTEFKCYLFNREC